MIRHIDRINFLIINAIHSNSNILLISIDEWNIVDDQFLAINC